MSLLLFGSLKFNECGDAYSAHCVSALNTRQIGGIHGKLATVVSQEKTVNTVLLPFTHSIVPPLWLSSSHNKTVSYTRQLYQTTGIKYNLTTRIGSISPARNGSTGGLSSLMYERPCSNSNGSEHVRNLGHGGSIWLIIASSATGREGETVYFFSNKAGYSGLEHLFHYLYSFPASPWAYKDL